VTSLTGGMKTMQIMRKGLRDDYNLWKRELPLL
jgi:hypothetical protein